MIRELLLSLEKWLPRGVRRSAERVFNTVPPSIRYGKLYREATDLLEGSQWWTAETHERWQLQQLQLLLHHAFDHSPFYRRLYNAYGVRPSQLTSLDDLRLFPTVTKDDLRSYREEIRVTNFPPRKFQYHTTGGSTGKPVGLYWEADRTVPLERAFMRRQLKWVGFDIDRDRSVALRGLPVRGGELFEKLPVGQIRLSSYDMTPENLDRYIAIIDEFKPIALLAYPSAAFIFSQHIARRGGVEFDGLRAVLCGSENIYPWQREPIAKAFRCRVYSWYGQSEYVSLGGECEHSSEYHFYSEYGVTEFLGSDGMPVAPGQAGEIVATGFNNRAFPLIRFRTEDVARVSIDALCKCGRSYRRASEVEGRLQEMIVARDGNLISMTAINMHSDVFDNVAQFQFYQDKPGKVTLRIVRHATFGPNDEARIRHSLFEKLRERVDVEFAFVEEIALSPRGKATFLEQRISIDAFANRLQNKADSV